VPVQAEANGCALLAMIYPEPEKGGRDNKNERVDVPARARLSRKARRLELFIGTPSQLGATGPAETPQ